MNDAPAPTLTIVIPAHNEASHLESSVRAIRDEVAALGEPFEIVVVDDGSSDGTWALLRRMASADGRLGALRLSRRFGKEAAISAGLARARGQAAIVMDSDLQHPPGLIPEMYRLWKVEGSEVVDAVKRGRGDESMASGVPARAFYRLFARLSAIDLTGMTDFKLMDRKAIDAWAGMPERAVFFRGMSAWIGFRRAQIPFDVPRRAAGRSQWSLLRLTGLAIDGLTSFSALPIHVITLMGALFLVVAMALGGLALYYRLTGTDVPGFATVIILQLVIGSMLMIGIGVIGQYIAKIYDEVKGRPRFIVAESTPPVSRAPE